MSDFATIWNQAEANCDWVMSGTQPATGGDLGTAILISVFTDRIAEPDDAIPDLTTDPRGWWGDIDEPHRVGSRMWLLSRSKQTPDVLLRAKDYLAEALQWLIDDGVVKKFNIEAEFSGAQLHARVTAWRSDGAALAQRFSWVWGKLTPDSGSFTS
jgi:phage gp46-like protein